MSRSISSSLAVPLREPAVPLLRRPRDVASATTEPRWARALLTAGALGFLLCWVGALLTLPLSTIGSYYMARQLVGDEPVVLPPL